MTCPLCAAIRIGLHVTEDTPLPCRLRPERHDPDPDDPFHGAVFTSRPGEGFEQKFVDELQGHVESTTPAQRKAAHAPHIERAKAHLTKGT